MDVQENLKNFLKKRIAKRKTEPNAKEEPPPKQRKQSTHDPELEGIECN